MKILVACEYSGRVRDAFIAMGHDAISCDLLPTETEGPHYQGDVFDIINNGFDMMIAHPPCTYLANSGAKHLYAGMKKENGRNEDRWQKMKEGAVFFKRLLDADIPKIAIENPIMIGHAKKIIGQSQSQVIQPWQFGHGETKATCLWLKGLPKLQPTDIVEGREARVHMLPPSEDRWKLRSTTYQGIANAMAQQWGVENLNKILAIMPNKTPLKGKAMAKTTKPMIKISIVGYIPAADIMDRDSIEEQFSKLERIKNFADEEFHEVETFAKRAVGRQYDAPEPKTEPAPKAEVTETYTPIEFPKSWAAEQGIVSIDDVKTKARHKASMSAEEFAELPAEESDALIAAMVQEMDLKPEDAE